MRFKMRGRRSRVKRRTSRRAFRKTTGTHRKNLRRRPMRGGFRM